MSPPNTVNALNVAKPMCALEPTATAAAPSARWGETPFAVVVPRQAPGEPESLASELRDWVNQRVGKQQRVAGLRFVERLPRNPNGKILKRELRREYAKLAG